MKTALFMSFILVLSGCYVDESASLKNFEGGDSNAEEARYEYLRFKMEFDNEITYSMRHEDAEEGKSSDGDGKIDADDGHSKKRNALLHIRVLKDQLARCKIGEARVCLVQKDDESEAGQEDVITLVDWFSHDAYKKNHNDLISSKDEDSWQDRLYIGCNDAGDTVVAVSLDVNRVDGDGSAFAVSVPNDPDDQVESKKGKGKQLPAESEPVISGAGADADRVYTTTTYIYDKKEGRGKQLAAKRNHDCYPEKEDNPSKYDGRK